MKKSAQSSLFSLVFTIPPLIQTPLGADLGLPVTVPTIHWTMPDTSGSATTWARASGPWWPTVLPSLSFTLALHSYHSQVRLLRGTIILFMGLLCLTGNTIQEVGVEMTMSCSIRWVAVIDGSLYS